MGPTKNEKRKTERGGGQARLLSTDGIGSRRSMATTGRISFFVFRSSFLRGGLQ